VSCSSEARLLRHLGVKRDADEGEIKKAYRRLAMKHHPTASRPERKKAAEAKFKENHEAYEVLRDPERRATYDRYGEAGLRRGAGARGGGFTHFDLSEALNIFMRDFGGLGGSTPFSTARTEPPGTQPGEDLKVTLKLSLAEVASGTTKKVKSAP